MTLDASPMLRQSMGKPKIPFFGEASSAKYVQTADGTPELFDAT